MKSINVFLVIFLFLKICAAAPVNNDGFFISGEDETKSSDGNFQGISKVKDLIIYKDTLFYSAFPSVVKRRNGEILVAFRRAPDRRFFGEEGYSHTDPNSTLMMVRSRNWENWTREPELIHAHPFGGSQDPCLLQLKDGTLLCSSYAWAPVRPDADTVLFRGISFLKSRTSYSSTFTFLGGYLVGSSDGGKSWKGPFYPPHVAADIQVNIWGDPLPAYNRGAMCEGKNGKIYWVVAAKDSDSPPKSSTHLLVSEDKGITWSYSSPVASDEKISFNETSLIETPKGDLVAFLRTADMPGRFSCIARSSDGGKSFQWQSMDFYGFPLHALSLPDHRVLLTYGYRQQPYGIRARILNPECTDFDSAPELIIRDDGGTGDMGYPWAVMLDKKQILVVYYFNQNNGTRYIAGTILELYKK